MTAVMLLVFAVMLRVRLRFGVGGGISASIGDDFGDGGVKSRLTSLLLSNTAAAASSHVGIGGSCLAGVRHGVVSGIEIVDVVCVVGDCCWDGGVSCGVDATGDGGVEFRLSSLSLLLLLKTVAAASSHVGIGGSGFNGADRTLTLVVGDGWAVDDC